MVAKFFWAWVVFAADPVRAESFRTGNDFREQLDLPASIAWKGNPLRPALGNFSRAQRVAVWLDRRVDPGREVDLVLGDQPLDRVLQQLAGHLGLGRAYVGPVAYLGPQSAATRLATVAALRQNDVAKLPAAVRDRLARPRPTSWPELSTPRELIEQCCREFGVTPYYLDRLPHDLWPAVELPPLTFAERMSLLLVGFEQTFELSRDGAAVRAVPLPENPMVERTYTLTASQKSLPNQLASRFPDARFETRGTQMQVTTTAEQHDAIDRLLRGQKSPRTDPPVVAGGDNTRYTMQISQAQLGNVIEGVATRLGLTVTWLPPARERATERISFQVQQVPRDKLLDAIFANTGLKYRVNGAALEIRAE